MHHGRRTRVRRPRCKDSASASGAFFARPTVTDARISGMRTIYIQRRTEDPEEDMSAVRADVDWFVDGIDCATDRGGLVTVAEGLGA
jgi:hypothetical protein